MFNIVKSVISAGGYKLAEIQPRIKKMYMLGDITEAQMDQLLDMASGGVSTDAERPEVLDMIRSLSERVDALEAILKDAEPETDANTYPNWVSWDGISKNYPLGAIVRHNGQLWESVFNGQNVWEPGAAGTGGLWVAYTPA